MESKVSLILIPLALILVTTLLACTAPTSAPTKVESPTPTSTPTSTATSTPEAKVETKPSSTYDLPIAPMCVDQVDVPLPKPFFDVSRKQSEVIRPTLDSGSRYSGLLIDAHVHVDPPERNQEINPDGLAKILNAIQANGVDIAVLMPTPNDGRFANHLLGVTQRVALKDMAPDNIRLFAGSNYMTYWLHQCCHGEEVSDDLDDVLAQLSEDVSSGDYIGVGEIGVLHFIKKPDQSLIAFQPNFAPFLDIVEEVAKHNLWLDLHIEPIDPDGISYEDWAFGGLQLLLDRNPTLKVILSHTAMTNPDNARRILETYPNVMMNIKPTMPTESWRVLEPVLNNKGELYEDWALLFEEMPDRFMIGSDAKFMRRGFTSDKYEWIIEMLRLMLGNLSAETAQKIAYDNAKKMFSIEK